MNENAILEIKEKTVRLERRIEISDNGHELDLGDCLVLKMYEGDRLVGVVKGSWGLIAHSAEQFLLGGLK